MGIERRQAGADLFVAISGRIDERFDPGGVGAGIGRVVINVGGVTSISSIGVRSLESFFVALAGRELVLIYVPPPLALQLKLIPTLQRHAQIQSARLPFICARCNAERMHDVPWRSDAHRRFAPTCSCGVPMDLDGLPEHYLPDPA